MPGLPANELRGRFGEKSMRVISCACALVALLALYGVADAAGGGKKELKIGFIYISPVGDSGWSYAHDIARRKLGMDPANVTFVAESVPDGPDFDRVITSMAKQGYDLIVTTSFSYMDGTAKAAKAFPEVTFLHCSGYKTAPNLSVFFGRLYQVKYLAGMVAGGMTKSNIIGYAASHPFPEMVRGVNAFALGAQAVNPKAEVRVLWTNAWFDPMAEEEAARKLISEGADVLAQKLDSPTLQRVAQEAGVYSIGYSTDMSADAPRSHMTATVWNWSVFYERVLEEMRNGSWRSGTYWPGVESGIVDLAPFGPMVPKALQDAVMARKQEIIDGTFVVLGGPVYDQAGNVRIPEGAAPTDKELLEMDWLVRGVVGGIGE